MFARETISSRWSGHRSARVALIDYDNVHEFFDLGQSSRVMSVKSHPDDVICQERGASLPKAFSELLSQEDLRVSRRENESSDRPFLHPGSPNRLPVVSVEAFPRSDDDIQQGGALFVIHTSAPGSLSTSNQKLEVPDLRATLSVPHDVNSKEVVRITPRPTSDVLCLASGDRLKKMLLRRVRNGNCDASYIEKKENVEKIIKILLKVPLVPLPGKEALASMRVSSFDGTGTFLGHFGDSQNRLPDGTPREEIWVDDKMAARASERSFLLALIMRPVLFSPVHRITRLVLDKCSLTDADAFSLAAVLRHKPNKTWPMASPHIEFLSLRKNDITDIGLVQLKKAVKYHADIVDILLEGNLRISSPGYEHPAENKITDSERLVPFLDSPCCGYNKELQILRVRLEKNRTKKQNGAGSCLCL